MTRDNKKSLHVKNYAEEYAEKYSILRQSVNETGAEFRERVARTLFQQNRVKEANQVLFNQSSGTFFDFLHPGEGYEDEFITDIATLVESSYQNELHPPRFQRFQRCFAALGCAFLALVCLGVIVVVFYLSFHH